MLRSLSEIIALLERSNPETLRELRVAHPQETMLRGGAIEGGREGGVAGTAGLADTGRNPRIWAETALLGLQSYVTEAAALTVRLRRRLKTSRRLLLGGELLTTAASASILVVLGKQSPGFFLIASVLSLAGVLGARAAKYLQGDPVSGDSVAAWFARLVADQEAVSQLQTALRIELEREPLDAKRIDELLVRAMALVALANKIRAYFG